MKYGKITRCGAADSKYFCNLEQFDKDMNRHIEEREILKAEVKELLLRDPGDMEERVHITLDAIREIKEKYSV